MFEAKKSILHFSHLTKNIQFPQKLYTDVISDIPGGFVSDSTDRSLLRASIARQADSLSTHTTLPEQTKEHSVSVN